MALRPTQPLTEMSTRSIWLRRPVRNADNLPTSCAVVTKSGNLNFLESFGPVQACKGTALPLPFILQGISARSSSKHSTVYTAATFTKLNTAWQIFVDTSSIEFCPTWTTNLQRTGRILLGPSVKFGFSRTHCSPSQKLLNDSTLRSSAPKWITGAQVMLEVRREVHLECWVKQGCRSAASEETCVCNVYWTVHHCNSSRMKDQLDVTCYFISLLMCSTCFGH